MKLIPSKIRHHPTVSTDCFNFEYLGQWNHNVQRNPIGRLAAMPASFCVLPEIIFNAQIRRPSWLEGGAVVITQVDQITVIIMCTSLVQTGVVHDVFQNVRNRRHGYCCQVTDWEVADGGILWVWPHLHLDLVIIFVSKRRRRRAWGVESEPSNFTQTVQASLKTPCVKYKPV